MPEINEIIGQNSSPPVIRNLQDIYNFLVQNDEFDLQEAAAVHWFRTELKNKLRFLEHKRGEKLTDEQVEQYIFDTYGVEELNAYNKKAANTLLLLGRNLIREAALEHIEKRENAVLHKIQEIIEKTEKGESLILSKFSEINKEIHKPEKLSFVNLKAKVFEHLISLTITGFIFFVLVEIWPYIVDFMEYVYPYILNFLLHAKNFVGEFFKYLYGIATHEFNYHH